MPESNTEQVQPVEPNELKDIKPLATDTATIPPTRAEKDLQMWHTWKKSGDPEHLRILLRAYDPVVHRFISQYATSGVPYPALEADAKLNAIKGFQSFDPGKGVQLNTHVTNMLKKVQRTVYEGGSLTRVPEHRAVRVGTFLSVSDFLKEKLGRDPTVSELHEELAAGHPIDATKPESAWSKPEIVRMQSELHKTLLSGEDTLGDTAVQKPSRESEVLDYLMYELTPLEQSVYEHLTGRHGKPVLDGVSIAKKLNLTPSRVSRIRQKISEKFEKYREKPRA